MASETSPKYSGTVDQPPIEEAPPPVYDDATGVLDVRHEGVNAQTKVTG
jgi:hypothetical protein